MEILATTLLVTLVWKFNDFLRFLRDKNWEDASTQAAAWVAGVAGTFLVAQTQFAEQVEVLGGSLSGLGSPELLVIGLLIASTAGVGHDAVKALAKGDVRKLD